MQHGDEAKRRVGRRAGGVAPGALWAVAAGRYGTRAVYGLADHTVVVGVPAMVT